MYVLVLSYTTTVSWPRNHYSNNNNNHHHLWEKNCGTVKTAVPNVFLCECTGKGMRSVWRLPRELLLILQVPYILLKMLPRWSSWVFFFLVFVLPEAEIAMMYVDFYKIALKKKKERERMQSRVQWLNKVWKPTAADCQRGTLQSSGQNLRFCESIHRFSPALLLYHATLSKSMFYFSFLKQPKEIESVEVEKLRKQIWVKLQRSHMGRELYLFQYSYEAWYIMYFLFWFGLFLETSSFTTFLSKTWPHNIRKHPLSRYNSNICACVYPQLADLGKIGRVALLGWLCYLRWLVIFCLLFYLFVCFFFFLYFILNNSF